MKRINSKFWVEKQTKQREKLVVVDVVRQRQGLNIPEAQNR